ncbi:hypothetical protein EW026_g4575 [Hermanssonia centrifuga]|uniref:Chromo domain-containing protein n=1 Tax=Hermanssonia centrifuga TaxID=98765 RepID=A0A4S4KGR4_9APHY|nr:hypothetical protein EW026_g4575 [Hermanssonia centrifuga]
MAPIFSRTAKDASEGGLTYLLCTLINRRACTASSRRGTKEGVLPKTTQRSGPRPLLLPRLASIEHTTKTSRRWFRKTQTRVPKVNERVGERETVVRPGWAVHYQDLLILRDTEGYVLPVPQVICPSAPSLPVLERAINPILLPSAERLSNPLLTWSPSSGTSFTPHLSPEPPTSPPNELMPSFQHPPCNDSLYDSLGFDTSPSTPVVTEYTRPPTLSRIIEDEDEDERPEGKDQLSEAELEGVFQLKHKEDAQAVELKSMEETDTTVEYDTSMSDYSEESVELVLPSTLSSTPTASKTIPSPVPSIAIDKRIRNAHAHLSLIIPNPSTSTSPTPSPRPKTHPTLAHPIEYLQLPLASPHGSAAAGQGQEQEPGMRSVFGNVSNVTGAFHPETDGASERTNRTIIQALRYHVERNQTGWARALPLVRFNHMNTINASTGFTPFQLHCGRQPRVIPPLFTAAGTRPGTDADHTAALLKRLDADVMEAQDNLLLAKSNQAYHADKHRGKEHVYHVGDKAMLSTFHCRRDFMQHGDHRVAKFMVRWDGPYKVVRAWPESSLYELDLPQHSNAFPKFHSSLLKPHIPNDDSLYPSRAHAKHEPIFDPETSEDQHFVEKILDRRHCGCGWQYLIRWKDFGPEHDLWLPGSCVNNLEALDVYLRDVGLHSKIL